MVRTFFAALGLALPVGALVFLSGFGTTLQSEPNGEPKGAAATSEHPFGPGAVPFDDFRESVEGSSKPVRGGRLVVHIPSRPLHLNHVIEAGADARRILEEVHARLVERNMETWELEPSLAESIEVFDRLNFLPSKGGSASSVYGREVYGSHAKFAWLPIEWSLPDDPSSSEETPPTISFFNDGDYESVDSASVFLFRLRQDALWHDGHRFDAGDVIFTLDTYLNPAVQSEHARHLFQQIRSYEALDAYTVRVEFEQSYFMSLDIFEDDFAILPSHIFNLADEDNPHFDSEATDAERAEFIHSNSANVNWVGLGPYRVTEFSDQHIEAERFDNYFDKQDAGWVDEIRWRIIPDDNAAKQALLAGEIDFFGRLRSRELLGEFTAQEAFAEQFDKGFYYSPQMNFIAWNQRRALFRDVRVRQALAHSFDWQEFIDTIGSEMGEAVTATWYRFSPAYDAELERFPFDLDRAEELLAESGWFDRDGDGVIDKDGERFEFEYLFNKNDATMRLVGQKLKENLERIGIVMNMAERDFAAKQALVGERNFDAAAGSWILGPETDPVGLWHSKGADVERSFNQSGYRDERSDQLIEDIQGELDDNRRIPLYHELQARIYEAQPMMFGCVFPVKFAVSKRVRGVQRFFLDPGYSLRRWFILPKAEKR